LRKVAWLAGAQAAALRCHRGQRAQALDAFARIGRAIGDAQPEGSAIARTVASLRATCQA